MLPNAGREVDAVNFRSVKESESVDIGAARVRNVMRPDPETPGEREVDPFEEFNSGECDGDISGNGHGLTGHSYTAS